MTIRPILENGHIGSPSGCPMDALMRVLMGAWTTHVLWALRKNGPTRFGALRRLVPGVSSKVLTDRLRMLESAQIITREHVATIPPQVTYALSARGHDLSGVLDQLYAVACKWDAGKKTDGKADRQPAA
jgi:DNA-binding HxlR family transcriptional regulator